MVLHIETVPSFYDALVHVNKNSHGLCESPCLPKLVVFGHHAKTVREVWRGRSPRGTCISVMMKYVLLVQIQRDKRIEIPCSIFFSYSAQLEKTKDRKPRIGHG
ncbi:unnamed protein product [Chrysodeixis includens]|uniref:Uncharacterized protein n=1 Tax=Chrysodeixis includens TaxID=689277 RepID=A0A9N8PY33_CHRIL|nr:unnamed protein product [Chrysodeixis includens]